MLYLILLYLFPVQHCKGDIASLCSSGQAAWDVPNQSMSLLYHFIYFAIYSSKHLMFQCLPAGIVMFQLTWVTNMCDFHDFFLR